jgi:DNA-binding LacI/PurR family transcriptional regulator
VDGFILFCLDGAEQLIAKSRERQLPFVALAFGQEDEANSVVAVDNVAGARWAAQYLLDLGHRKFAILAMEFVKGGSGRITMEQVSAAPSSASVDRVRGYFEALEASGVDTSQVPIYETQEDDTATVFAMLGEIFSSTSPPTAILAQSDRIALIALDWLKDRGISVPGDVSVVGFDGVPESATSQPPLTTIQQPIVEIGRRAVRAIMEHAGEVRHELMDAELVVRESTAPPRLTATHIKKSPPAMAGIS